jgi:hypothetical protein
MAEIFHKSTGCPKFPLLYFLSIIALVFGFHSCTSPKLQHKIDHGIVTYDISYKNNSGRSFPIQLLPKTLEMKFNQHFTSYSIEDRVGLFSICNITNLKTRGHSTLIKVFDKKFIFQGTSKEPPVFFKKNLSFDVAFLPDTCSLAGLLCYKANVTNKETSQTFPVLYSKNVGLKNPNYNTPYEKIDGLLLQFGLQLKNLDMNLIAKKIDAKEIKDDEFIVPAGYKYINKAQMEEIINTLLP